jgi:hypothetical protein
VSLTGFDENALDGVENRRIVGGDLDALVLGPALGDVAGAGDRGQVARVHGHAGRLDPPDRLQVGPHGLGPAA